MSKNTKQFSKKEALVFGWNTFKSNLFLLVSVMAASLLVNPGLDLIVGPALADNLAALIFIRVLQVIFGILISIGLIVISLKLVDGQKSSFGDLFTSFRLFFKFLGGQIVYSLVIVVGLVLFIIPGVVWGNKYSLYGYFIVDKEFSPIAALKASSALTKGVRMNVFVFNLLLLGINIIGVITFYIGSVVTIPLVVLASAFVYRRLLSQTQI